MARKETAVFIEFIVDGHVDSIMGADILEAIERGNAKISFYHQGEDSE